jgi:hypothetical protein
LRALAKTSPLETAAKHPLLERGSIAGKIALIVEEGRSSPGGLKWIITVEIIALSRPSVVMAWVALLVGKAIAKPVSSFA